MAEVQDYSASVQPTLRMNTSVEIVLPLENAPAANIPLQVRYDHECRQDVIRHLHHLVDEVPTTGSMLHLHSNYCHVIVNVDVIEMYQRYRVAIHPFGHRYEILQSLLPIMLLVSHCLLFIYNQRSRLPSIKTHIYGWKTSCAINIRLKRRGITCNYVVSNALRDRKQSSCLHLRVITKRKKP